MPLSFLMISVRDNMGTKQWDQDRQHLRELLLKGAASTRTAPVDAGYFEGLRFWPFPDYPYVVFYTEGEGHVDIWRVLHGQRDIPTWMTD